MRYQLSARMPLTLTLSPEGRGDEVARPRPTTDVIPAKAGKRESILKLIPARNPSPILPLVPRRLRDRDERFAGDGREMGVVLPPDRKGRRV
jgi:hypothetical protein